MMEFVDSYSGIRLNIHNQFNSLLDYIFKTPQFIDGQVAIERRKLDSYFPAQSGPNPDEHVTYLRNLRSEIEGARLFNDFPRFMAASNLFLAAAIFERFLYEICKKVESAELQLSDQRGNGIGRYFGFLCKVGLLPDKTSFYQQIDSAIAFRNALLHADGRMEICRNSSKIERIVRSHLYIEPSRRLNGPHTDENGHPEVGLSGYPVQLKIDNFYVYRATAYFRDYLLDFTNQAMIDVR